MAFSVVPAAIAIPVVRRTVGAVAVTVPIMLLFAPAGQRGTRRESNQRSEKAYFFLFREDVLDLLRLFIASWLVIEHVDLRPPGDPLEGEGVWAAGGALRLLILCDFIKKEFLQIWRDPSSLIIAFIYCGYRLSHIYIFFFGD